MRLRLVVVLFRCENTDRPVVLAVVAVVAAPVAVAQVLLGPQPGDGSIQ